MMLALRAYQAVGVDFLASRGRAILADDMGLGKTATMIATLKVLTPRRTLIVAPKSAIGVWRDELQEWLNVEPLVYVGSRQDRAKLIPAWRSGFLLCSYQMAEEVTRLIPTTDALVVDEAHVLRNRQTNLFGSIRSIAAQAKYFYAMTGTPIVNGVPDLWTLLFMIDPHRFSSYWAFVKSVCYVSHNGYGLEINGVRNPERVKQILSHYLIRRTAKDPSVKLELPEIIRQRVHLTMTPKQSDMYHKIGVDREVFLNDNERLLSKIVIAQLTRLRQLLITPQLIGAESKQSALLVALEEYLEADNATGESVVIFTPYVESFSYLTDVCHKVGYPVPYLMHGQLTSGQMSKAIKGFQESDEPSVLLASVEASTGWSATKATRAYFAGYSWTPAMNMQAEKRIHRIGQDKPCIVRYFYHENTIDTHIMSKLDQKYDTIQKVI